MRDGTVAKEEGGVRALEGRRVLDLAGPSGVYCGKVLADLGADVIKIEVPGGDPTRRLPPFKDDSPHLEHSLYFQYYNMSKRGITLDIETADGGALLRRLAERADIIFETFPVGYMDGLGLGYAALSKLNPGLIYASITPFGQTGPYRDYKASDLVAFALGTPLQISGTPDGVPCVAPGQLAYDCTSLCTGIAILAALNARWMTGRGQYLDSSLFECTIEGTAAWAIPALSYSRAAGRPHMVQRTGTKGAGNPGDIYPCKDGFVRFCILPVDQWRATLEWVGRPEAISGPEWDSMTFRNANRDVVDLYVKQLTMQHTKRELYDEGQKRGLAITPVYDPKEVIEDPQTRARQFFNEVEHPVIGKFLTPGTPFHVDGNPSPTRRAAPLLGEHNLEVYCDELGLSGAELVALRQAGAI